MYQRTGLLLLFTFLIFGLAASTLAHTQETTPSDAWSLQVLESDERHLLLELALPAFETETVIHDGIEYQRLRVAEWPSWGQSGQPLLPMQSVPLGMPWPGTPKVTVTEAESQTVEGYLIYPVPALTLGVKEDTPYIVETFAFDPGIYSADTFYPGPLAEAASIGLLRDRPLFQLRLYPFQYNPLRRELRAYRRLRVLVTFPQERPSPTLFGARPLQSSPIFESILEQTLLNYDTLPQPSPASARCPMAPLGKLDSGPQVKLKVEHSGLYRVTHQDLQAVAPAILSGDPRNLELSNQGSSIPILFDGQEDGTFDPDDSFTFYGQAINSDYTRHNVYWLSDNGAPGLRMAQRDGTPGAGTTPITPTAFADSRHYEEDDTYWQSLPNGEGKDHWFWDKLSVSGSTPVSADYAFDLHHIAASGPDGELRLMLHGLTGGGHLTQVYLNDVALLTPAEQAWSGQVEKLYEISVPQSLFVEGSNHLEVENILPTGQAVSKIYVNWFEVTYQDTYVAEEDCLLFSAPSAGTYAFELVGFSTNAVELFDITAPSAPVRIINHVVEPEGGDYRLRFNDSATADGQYLAQRADQLPTPSMQLDKPSTWKSAANGATYIIITHPSFYDRLQSLATYRAGQGETVVTVKTEDIYDEFYHGIYDPQAIHSFLEYAYHNWSPQPVYVLLVGDASLDPKNNRGSSLPDLLPTYYVDISSFGQAPNDNWYAKVHGDDDYPDLIVGRIPARWNSNIDTVTNKVQTYEGSPPPGDWVRRAVLVADDDEPSFAQDMDTIADLLPASITPIKMYDYNPNTSVQDEVSAGVLLLAYSGHGSSHGWASWNGHTIFSQSSMWNLQNGDQLPFMTVGTCFNGFFASYSSTRSAAELFLVISNKGGIASWAPSGYGFPDINSLMLEELYKALLVDGDLTLGSAATSARIQAYLRRPYRPLSLFETFIYFGDPAVRLNVPATLELEGQDSHDPITMGDFLTYTLTYTVSGADQARDLTLVNTLPQGTIYQSASPPPSSIYAQSLTWNLGDTPIGSYTVTVTAQVKTTGLAHGQILQNQVHLYDANGGDHVLQIETTVHDVPIAGLSASNDGPTELGDVTTLSAGTTSGTNVVYTWDFDDGSPQETGSPAQHTYPAIGTYLALVTATNSVSSQNQTATVAITDVPPAASFITSSPDRLGQTTTFQSTSGGTNLTYQWDFGDGSSPVSSPGPTITHVYFGLGSYGVVLTVTNSVGTDVTTDIVDILEAVSAPVAGFASSSPDELGQTTSFTNISQDGGDDEENVLYTWDFGDETSSTLKHPTHTYDTVEAFLVSLTISNSVASDTFSDIVLITDVPISGLVIGHNNPTILGNATALSATITSGSNVSYLWALGDGTFSTGQNLTHTYGAVGSYTVVLTATNGAGSRVITSTVTIVDEEIEGLTISNSGPTFLGSSTTFTTLLTAGTNVTYLWDLGDSTTSTQQNPVHTYSAVGDYTVILTATNGWGSLVRSDTVAINDVPISGLSISLSSPATPGTPITLTASVATGTNVIYNWDLGDGHAATGNHLIHTYAAPGTYELTATAVNGTNESAASATVTILAPGTSVFLPLISKP